VRAGYAVSWVSINHDKKTVEAMIAALYTENETEKASNEALNEILANYKSASIASTGIYMKEYMEYKAMSDPSSYFTSAKEYFYYRHIFDTAVGIGNSVSQLAPYLVKSPEKIFYWGTYMFQTCDETIELCKLFQSVCTNGKLGFEGIRFRELAPDLKKFVNPVKMDLKNYEEKFNDLTSTKGLEDLDESDLQEALYDVAQAGVSIAASGWQGVDDLALKLNPQSRIVKALKMKYTDAMYLYEGFRETREQMQRLANINAIKNTIRNLIEVNGHEVADRIFHIADYNVNTYMADYVRNESDGYFTQRYYIYSEDAGTKVLCDYKPKAEDDRDKPWIGWLHFISPRDNEYCHVLTSSEIASAKSISERQAGWSQASVDKYNIEHPGHNATITYNLLHENLRESYKHWWGSTHHKRHCFYAYAIKVVDTWNTKNVVYDAVFDSRTMNKQVFEEQMKMKLAELNSEGDESAYKIGYDDPVPYQSASPSELSQASTATFTLDCQSGEKLASSSLQWKENGNQGNSLTPSSINFAMETELDLSSMKKDLNAMDRLIEENAQAMRQKNQEIKSLNIEYKMTFTLMQEESRRGNYTKYQELRQQLKDLETKIQSLKKQYSDLEVESSTLKDKREELKDDYNDTTDGGNRLPAIMKSLESAFGLTWKGDGQWDTSDGSCYRYTRKANYRNLGELTFKAELTLYSGPKHFIGIRIHRAKLNIDWKLTNENPHSDVVEVLQLDKEWSDKEKADKVNERISYWLQSNPNCTCRVEYNKENKDSLNDVDDAAHLLWVSDRLAIASEIDSRLSKIYSDLQFLLGYYKVKSSIKDFLKQQIISVASVNAKNTLALDCLERWRSCNDSTRYSNPKEGERVNIHEIASRPIVSSSSP
jgi:hypothetical protein